MLQAILTRDLLAIKKILAKGCDINQFFSNDFTPLMQAIELEEVEIVKISIAAGADVNLSPYFEDNPLGLAAEKENLEIVELLLKAGADPDRGGERSPLFSAVDLENIKMLQMLLEAGADINIFSPSYTTCLMSAAGKGSLKLVRYLVNAGANVNVVDDNGNTALMRAAWYGHQEVFDYLFPLTTSLEDRNYAQQEMLKNKNIRRRKKKQFSNKTKTMLPHPQFMELYQGIESQNIDLLKTLLSDPEYLRHLDWNEEYLIQISLDDYKDDYYELLLEKAVEIGNVEIVRILLEKGRHLPYWRMCLGASLELAASLNNLELVQILLENGADPKRYVREPAIIIAAGTGNIEMVQLLISSGADVNSAREEGVTPLMVASISGSIEIVKLLVEHGAKLDATLVNSWDTALDSARYYGHEDICQYLESHIVF